MAIDLSPIEREVLGRAALDFALEYVRTQSDLPVYPTTSAKEMARLPGSQPGAVAAFPRAQDLLLGVA